MKKTCTKCGEEKEGEYFGSRGGGDRNLHSHCRDCRKAYKRFMSAKKTELKGLNNEDFYKKLEEIKQKSIALPSFDNGTICERFEEMNRIF